MEKLALIDRGKFEKTKGTRGKPGRYLIEIELENIYKQNTWLLNLDRDDFDTLIKNGVPNQKSAIFFIDWIVDQIKNADTAISKIENSNISQPDLDIARWIFYKRLSSCVNSVNSLLTADKFKRTYTAEVKRILKEYSYLYKVKKPEERELMRRHDEALLFQKEPWLKQKKKDLLRVIEGLLLSYEDAEDDGNRENMNGIAERFSHIMKCLYHSLKPLVNMELSKFTKKEINALENDHICDLKLLGFENNFISLYNYNAVKSVNNYRKLLDRLSLESLDALFTKGLDVVIADRKVYFNSEVRPTLFKDKYNTDSMTKEELEFHKYTRFEKISMFDEYYEEHQKEVEEFDRKFPAIPVGKVFSIDEQKLIEGTPEDEQLFINSYCMRKMLQ